MKTHTVPSNPWFSVTENYKIVWNKSGSILTPYSDKDGYLRYSYRYNNKTYHIAEHRAVAEIFVENMNPRKYKIVNHKDNNVKNNNPSNLEWVDYKINRNHSLVQGRGFVYGESHKGSVLNESLVHKICKLIDKGLTVKDICAVCDIERHHVYNIKSGKCWVDISSNYNLIVPKKETFGKSTIDWVKFRIDSGYSFDEILKMSGGNLTTEKLIRIISYIEDECND